MSFKESEQKAGLQELVSWLKNQRVISNYNAKIFSNDPEKFIEELCQGMILPKLAIMADPVSYNLSNLRIGQNSLICPCEDSVLPYLK